MRSISSAHSTVANPFAPWKLTPNFISRQRDLLRKHLVCINDEAFDDEHQTGGQWLASMCPLLLSSIPLAGGTSWRQALGQVASFFLDVSIREKRESVCPKTWHIKSVLVFILSQSLPSSTISLRPPPSPPPLSFSPPFISIKGASAGPASSCLTHLSAQQR